MPWNAYLIPFNDRPLCHSDLNFISWMGSKSSLGILQLSFFMIWFSSFCQQNKVFLTHWPQFFLTKDDLHRENVKPLTVTQPIYKNGTKYTSYRREWLSWIHKFNHNYMTQFKKKYSWYHMIVLLKSIN